MARNYGENKAGMGRGICGVRAVTLNKVVGGEVTEKTYLRKTQRTRSESCEYLGEHF